MRRAQQLYNISNCIVISLSLLELEIVKLQAENDKDPKYIDNLLLCDLPLRDTKIRSLSLIVKKCTNNCIF